MSDREELEALRRLAELEARAGTNTAAPTSAPSRSALGETGRQIGLTARHGIEGVGNTLDLLASPFRVGLNTILPDSMQIRGQTGQAISDLAGLPKPETGTERVAGDVARAMAGGGAFMKGAQIAAPAVSGVANSVMQQLAASPQAQIMAAGGAGAGSGMARESGVGGVGQFMAGLAGSLAPAGVGLGINAGRAVRDYIYPSIGSLGRRAAGDKVDDVIAAMLKTRSDVPGVKLTAGEAAVPANSAEFAAFQKAAANELPSKYYGPLGIKGQQATARQEAVRGFGKTPEELKAAIEARTAASNINYGKAYQQQVNADPELAKLVQNPYIKEVLPEALKLAKANKITPKENMTEFLHFVKEGLDAKLQAANNPNLPAISNSAKNAVQDAKSELVAWLAKKNPAYDMARIEHQAASQPINQMRTGQRLEQALVAPATGAERAASFGTAVRQAENTISKSSGKPVIESLTPAQRKIVSAIEEDFLRNQQFKELAASGKKVMEERIGAPVVPPTGMFQPMISAARSWVNKALGTGYENALRRAANVMDDPQELARMMQKAAPAERKVLEALLAQRLMQNTIATAGISQGE